MLTLFKPVPRTILLVAVLSSLLAGCSSLGPAALRDSRSEFNQAIRDSDAQEMLTNLLRMRYVEPMSFGAITQIQYARENVQSIGASSLLGGTRALPTGSETVNSAFTLGPASMSISDKPVITYSPLQGDKFVMSLMTPMQLNLLLLEIKSGWSVSRVFKIGVDQINGLRNQVSATEGDDGFIAFNRAVELLADLRDQRLADFNVHNGKPELRFARNSADHPQVQELRRLLRLDPSLDGYELVTGGAHSDGRHISISPRSLMSALHYLSFGIQIPLADQQAGRVSTKAPSEWSGQVSRLFRVPSSAEKPANAVVAVRYRNSWFYVADDDLSSKSSFVLLGQLYALHSVPPSSPAVQINSF